jgi:hypothetical protein
MSVSMPTSKELVQIITLGKGGNYYELNSLVSSGNAKLPSTTCTFNMSPAKLCPSLKLGLCKAYNHKGTHICYAKKAETKMTPEVLPYRMKQMKFWKNVTAEEFASQFLAINSLKRIPWTKLRFNESGDFHSQECLDKAEKIATYLNRFGIKTYCYTHRSDLNFKHVKNLIVSSSNFQSKEISNTFVMVKNVKIEKPKGWSVCKGDCTICDMCSIRGNKVVVKMH